MTVFAFSGSRDFSDMSLVVDVLLKLHERDDDDPTVRVGDARGLDEMVRSSCLIAKIPCVVLEADWKRHGKGAGHLRNGQVLDGADMLIAFFGPNGATPGTTDCLNQAKDRGIPAFVYHAHLGKWSRAVA